EKAPGFGPYVGRFFARRALRLLPAYLLVVFAVSFDPASTRAEMASLLTYTYNFEFILHPLQTVWYGHLWTLSVEWQFYLLWPFAVWFLPRRSLFLLAALLVATAPATRALTAWAVEAFAPGRLSPDAFLFRSTTNHLDALALGALLAHERFRRLCGTPWAFRAALAAVVAGGALVLVRTAASGAGDDIGFRSLGYPVRLPHGEYLWAYTVLHLFFAVVVAQTAAKASWTRFADVPALQYLGKISYGIYLFHLPVATLVAAWFGLAPGFATLRELPRSFAGLAVAVVLVVLAAHLSFRYYESVFLKKKHLFSFWRPASAPPSSASAPTPLS
ncbi:MAG TPA: acyltransferase, partial [Candidatus Methylacidiphilales bacterium]